MRKKRVTEQELCLFDKPKIENKYLLTKLQRKTSEAKEFELDCKCANYGQLICETIYKHFDKEAAFKFVEDNKLKTISELINNVELECLIKFIKEQKNLKIEGKAPEIIYSRSKTAIYIDLPDGTYLLTAFPEVIIANPNRQNTYDHIITCKAEALIIWLTEVEAWINNIIRINNLIPRVI